MDSMDKMETVGGRIRAAREKAGLTQAALGALSGVTGQTVSNLERGLGVPKAATARALARALGGEVTDYLDRTEGPGRPLALRMAGLWARAEGPFGDHLDRQTSRDLAFEIPVLREAFERGVREDWEAQQSPDRAPGRRGENWLVAAGELEMQAVWSRLGHEERSRLIAAAVTGEGDARTNTD